ncbi:MAG: oxidoreductase, partial [Oceanibaculum nanhaiense]|nr:oxidoreductase [Oceanibaculum nanhaiense]
MTSFLPTEFPLTAFPLTALAPLVLLAAALPFAVHPGRRPGRLPELAEAAGLASLLLVLGGLGQLLTSGPAEGLALVRLNAISVTLALLVAFVGWVVIRYSRRYLDGEAREGRFHGLVLAAIAAVLLLVQAASLWVLAASFIATGLILRQLLLFYPERAEARRAAAKFIRVWTAG